MPHQVMIMVVTFVLGYFTASIFDIETLSHWMTTQVLENHEAKQQVIPEQAQKERVAPKPKFEFYTLLANEKGVSAGQTAARANSANPQTPTTQTTTTANPVSTAQQPHAPTAVATAAATTTRIVVNKPNPVVNKPNSAVRPQPAPVQIVTAKPVANSSVRSGTYVVQVAAFKARNDAEHMKGLLTLKGFEVSVIPVTTANGPWFRVVIGPYPNRVLAQKAQTILARTERLNGMVRSAGG